MIDIIPKGILLPIGGGEDRLESKEVLSRMIQESGKKNPKICLITLATNVPERAAEVYNKAFKALKVSHVTVIHYIHRRDADTVENLKKVEDCDLVLLSGGKQHQLCALLGDTQLLDLMRRRYHDEASFVIAGTSAGAAAMSGTMISAGSSTEALIKGTLQLTTGLHLISGLSIDTHFTQRGRIGRLIEMVTGNPGVLGIGLGEDTGVVIKKGMMEVCGSGLVTIVDGHGLQIRDIGIPSADLTEIRDGSPTAAEGIKVHVLGPGKKFSIGTRKLVEARE